MSEDVKLNDNALPPFLHQFTKPAGNLRPLTGRTRHKDEWKADVLPDIPVEDSAPVAETLPVKTRSASKIAVIVIAGVMILLVCCLIPVAVILSRDSSRNRGTQVFFN